MLPLNPGGKWATVYVWVLIFPWRHAYVSATKGCTGLGISKVPQDGKVEHEIPPLLQQKQTPCCHMLKGLMPFFPTRYFRQRACKDWELPAAEENLYCLAWPAPKTHCSFSITPEIHLPALDSLASSSKHNHAKAQAMTTKHPLPPDHLNFRDTLMGYIFDSSKDQLINYKA